MNNKEKKVVVITGASSGIGKEVAKFFAKNGHIVYGLSRRTFIEDGVISLSCDVTDEQQVEKSIQDIYNRENKIDILINNAGFGISGSIENQQIKEIEDMFKVNFLGAVNVTQKVLPIMRKQKFGKIINTSSVAGTIPIPFQSFYSATKSSLDIWAMALRLEVKQFNIQVCNVLVGDTKTSFTSIRQKTQKDKGSVYEEVVKKSISKMERDEQNGKDPITVAKVMYKISKMKKLPVTKVVGLEYKLIMFLQKILPKKFMLFIVNKLYM